MKRGFLIRVSLAAALLAAESASPVQNSNIADSKSVAYGSQTAEVPGSAVITGNKPLLMKGANQRTELVAHIARIDLIARIGAIDRAGESYCGGSVATQKRTIELENKVYSLEAVKKACYRLSDRFSCQIGTRDATLICEFIFPENASTAQVESALDEFRKEVLDQDLRERIKKETEGVRNLVLAHAFSKSGLIGDE